MECVLYVVVNGGSPCELKLTPAPTHKVLVRKVGGGEGEHINKHVGVFLLLQAAMHRHACPRAAARHPQ